MNKKIIAGLLITTSISTTAVGQGDPKATEVWEPVPKIITPVIGNKPPSDAVVLFDGKDLSQWQTEKDGSPAKWSLEKEGVMTVKKGAGNVKTRQGFGSCQLHIEWRTPSTIEGEGQGRGNSGIFLMGLYELQVLDSYNNSTYSNGQAGSIYKQLIPLVNASLKPGEWQEYDVIFTAPKFKTDGSLVSPARITVLHNGVLVQNNVELKGGTVYIGQPSYKAHSDKEPLVLQDHGNPISFRNIWVREL
ncbi:MAG: 3-keto-disaccharide hydrolase [Chitinophagaceae bacterium]